MPVSEVVTSAPVPAAADAVAFAFAVAAAVIRPYPLFPLLKSDKHISTLNLAGKIVRII